MSKKNLILLTKQYPFGHGEQYVTSELYYLAKVYNRILLYPSDYFGNNEKPPIDVPSNVEVVCLNKNLPKDLDKRKMIFSFLKLSFYEFFRTHSKTAFIKNFKRSFYFYLTQYAQGVALERLAIKNGLNDNNTTYYTYWFSASAFCLAIMKDRNAIKHFYSKAHSVDLYHERWGLLNEKVRVPYFKNYKLKHVDAVFPISAHGGAFLKESYQGLNVSVKYLGVDDFGLNPSEKAAEFVIVTCSGLSFNKRVHLLGKALSTLNRKVKWIHFGAGSMEKELFDSVQSDNVKLDYRGRTANTDVRKFYASHHIDLFVNLSIVEGLPVSIMEALSHGIPTLATSVYGTPEAVIEGVSGKLIPVDFTNEQLAVAIEWFMDNPQEATEMRKCARKVFEEKFNAEKNHAEFAKYLSELP